MLACWHYQLFADMASCTPAHWDEFHVLHTQCKHTHSELARKAQGKKSSPIYVFLLKINISSPCAVHDLAVTFSIPCITSQDTAWKGMLLSGRMSALCICHLGNHLVVSFSNEKCPDSCAKWVGGRLNSYVGFWGLKPASTSVTRTHSQDVPMGSATENLFYVAALAFHTSRNKMTCSLKPPWPNEDKDKEETIKWLLVFSILFRE